MPASVFFDTDVLIDFCTQREPWFPPAARLLNLAAYRKIQGLTSASGLKDVFYFARKPEGEAKARKIIANLMKVIRVCDVTEAMWLDALSSPIKDTEDALQMACAIRNGVRFFVTRNVKHYRNADGIRVMPPPALAAVLKDDIQDLESASHI